MTPRDWISWNVEEPRPAPVAEDVVRSAADMGSAARAAATITPAPVAIRPKRRRWPHDKGNAA
jgi:hypothetical protein